jgi:hypothetical protein
MRPAAAASFAGREAERAIRRRAIGNHAHLTIAFLAVWSIDQFVGIGPAVCQSPERGDNSQLR